MIQRRQSLYLLLATVAMGLMFAAPLGHFLMDARHLILSATGVTELGGSLVEAATPLTALIVLSALLPLVTIFLYKNRTLQVKLCALEVALLLGTMISEGYYMYTYTVLAKSFEIHVLSYPTMAFMPLAAMLLTILAMAAIKKDEKLVRSIDRIR